MNNTTSRSADEQQTDAISPSAVVAFAGNRVKLTEAVNEKLALDACYGPDKVCGSLEASADFQAHFGRLLQSVYEFALDRALLPEFGWYVRTLRSRGFASGYFTRMLEAWTIAIVTSLGRRDAEQLLPPLVGLRNGLESLLTAPGPSEPVVSADVRKFLDLILSRRRQDATEFALRHARKGGAESCTEYVGPALDEVGRLWELNRISVADEHAATDICRHVVFRLCDELPQAKPLSLSALIACVPGEEHELAGEMLADRLEALGWTAHFVGHSLPESDLVQMAAKVKPDVIILSITLVENLAGLRHLLSDLRSAAPGARLLLGGPAAVTAREPLLRLCEAVADSIPDAVTIAMKLVTGNA